MQSAMTDVHFLAFSLGGEEAILVILALILFLSSQIPRFAHGLRRAIDEFRNAFMGARGRFDQAGFDAGQSLGGIHGKRAAEALTTDNQTVELYDPAVLRDSGPIGRRSPIEQRKIKNAITRILFFMAGGFVFGALAYSLYKLVFFNSN